jgi:hypothetical protein
VVSRTRRIRGAGREAGMGVNISAYRILVVKREREDTWKNYEVTGGKRWKCVVEQQCERVWAGLICIRIGTIGGLL